MFYNNANIVVALLAIICYQAVFVPFVLTSSDTEAKFNPKEIDHLLTELGKTLDAKPDVGEYSIPVYGGYWAINMFGSRDTTGDIDGVRNDPKDANSRKFIQSVIDVSLTDKIVAPRFQHHQKSEWFNFDVSTTGSKPTTGAVFKKYGRKLTILEPDWHIALTDKLAMLAAGAYTEKVKLDALAIYSHVIANKALSRVSNPWKRVSSYAQLEKKATGADLAIIQSRFNELRTLYGRALTQLGHIQWIANQEYLVKDKVSGGIQTSKRRIVVVSPANGQPIVAKNYQTGLNEFIISQSVQRSLRNTFKSAAIFITSRSNLPVATDSKKQIITSTTGHFYIQKKAKGTFPSRDWVDIKTGQKAPTNVLGKITGSGRSNQPIKTSDFEV